MSKYLEVAEGLEDFDADTFKAAALLREAAEMEAEIAEAEKRWRHDAERVIELESALREIGSYELNYARQESPLEALLALQRYARAALEVKE